jgi:4-hydroxy-3-polyprenylbenzoate decarboxylase
MAVYTIGITGASGSAYGLRVLKALVAAGHQAFVSMTRDGMHILGDETGLLLRGSEADIQRTLEQHLGAREGQVRYFDEDNLYAPIASGSAKVDAMAVVPCSMKAMASLANGFASNLIERAADVTLKERRKLVIVPRETPLSVIHLRNMLSLAEAGCHIIPAMPAFYHRPRTVDDLVDFIAGRVLDALGVENALSPRWGQ